MLHKHKGLFSVLGIIIVGLLLFLIFPSSDHWQLSIPEIGSASSPRAIDLNQDGILDIVLGGGGKEFASTEYGVIAIDGKDGSLLWHKSARNQIVGSALFKDINQDGIPDVIIGGRSAVLYALDGRNGSLLWEFLPDYEGMDALNDTTILNFFNPQLIPDADHDQLEDILIAYGGFVKAHPAQRDRPSGSLMVISSRDGKLLAKAKMPDGRETYMSPLVYDFEGKRKLEVIFGTGGETIGGYLYRIALQNILDGDLSAALPLASDREKGFIAPPVLADVNLDGIKDIVANAVNGRMLCIDGKTNQKIWDTTIGWDYEGYAMPAPGFFVNDDSIPDFFGCFGYGAWPNTLFAVNVLVDGRDGQIVFKDTVGTFQYASPLVFDFTRDGFEDVLVSANIPIKDSQGNILYPYGNQMKVFDVKEGEVLTFDEEKLGSNLGSTPLLTDLDGDGKLDIISCYMADAENFYSFKELKIERRELDLPLIAPIPWGAYMGSDFSAVWQK
ncbi:outer membrane protein assembly factor BamB family protein [Catalinimonas niigatensis]|uniref:outer membrane protein assembly factor BamB family protein n=1 Tax=Catalinimonas niigatensis TaxID=1397264 RepID=UPI0026650B6A|nr:PQQ-binding-like beta-propeller repeat protein [Catalinimonas niigatensis]WPP53469.1 PQQ-binding-like beta-propeller repeat protein [Catalinimonas niigatensis]